MVAGFSLPPPEKPDAGRASLTGHTINRIIRVLVRVMGARAARNRYRRLRSPAFARSRSPRSMIYPPSACPAGRQRRCSVVVFASLAGANWFWGVVLWIIVGLIAGWLIHAAI